MTKLEVKNTYVPKLFSKPSYLQKINLKRPLSRGSRFKIYFRLECRGNRGSRQNFHGIPFFKDRVLINPDHFVTRHLTTTCLFNKNKQFISKYGCKRHRHEHWQIRTKMRNKTTNRTSGGLSFLPFFEDSNKQK